MPVTNQPDLREWEDGLCDCTNDVKNCMLTAFCLPCMVCYEYKLQDEGCAAPLCVLHPVLVLASHYRGKQNIEFRLPCNSLLGASLTSDINPRYIGGSGRIMAAKDDDNTRSSPFEPPTSNPGASEPPIITSYVSSKANTEADLARPPLRPPNPFHPGDDFSLWAFRAQNFLRTVPSKHVGSYLVSLLDDSAA
nr:unnamed protein product [Spirometra erinaceieuropaei]